MVRCKPSGGWRAPSPPCDGEVVGLRVSASSTGAHRPNSKSKNSQHAMELVTNACFLNLSTAVRPACVSVFPLFFSVSLFSPHLPSACAGLQVQYRTHGGSRPNRLSGETPDRNLGSGCCRTGAPPVCFPTPGTGRRQGGRLVFWLQKRRSSGAPPGCFPTPKTGRRQGGRLVFWIHEEGWNSGAPQGCFPAPGTGRGQRGRLVFWLQERGSGAAAAASKVGSDVSHVKVGEVLDGHGFDIELCIHAKADTL
jgi:hypothetical protein